MLCVSHVDHYSSEPHTSHTWCAHAGGPCGSQNQSCIILFVRDTLILTRTSLVLEYEIRPDCMCVFCLQPVIVHQNHNFVHNNAKKYSTKQREHCYPR
jgi:hypothetical protein